MKLTDFFYTEGQTAHILGVNRLTVYRWIKSGKFDIQRVGREVLIPKWEVEFLKMNPKKRKRCIREFRN